MKTVRVILLSVLLLGTPVVAEPIMNEIVQTGSWEDLGESTAKSSQSYMTGHLYVRIFQGGYLYKFRWSGTDYTVTKSNNRDGYNAQLTKNNVIYYLNVPRW